MVPDLEFILGYFCIHRRPFYNTKQSAAWVEKWATEIGWEALECMFQERADKSEMSFWSRND